jgi:hypothetical protein
MTRSGIPAAVLALALGPAQIHDAPYFVDVAGASGIDFVSTFGGLDKKRYILETTGSGAAFLDYDEDGDQDLFLPNGTRLGYDEVQSPSNRLYRNEGDGTFSNVTAAARLEHHGWGQGASVSDFDNDGDPDLLVTYYGPNLFYRNEGDGTFSEIGAASGVADSHWGTSAAFADYDRDGTNDLAIANYVDLDLATTPGPGEHPTCFFMGIPVMCGPRGLPPARSLLYHGKADGTFEDVSGERSGVGIEAYYGLGAVWGDVDNDGDVDLYFANDQMPSNLYRNEGGGRFTEIAVAAGVAYNEDGRAQAGMGVDLGDYDNDGWLDIHKTNFANDHNTLYRNMGEEGYFLDVSYRMGIGEPSYPFLGWGTGFHDFDRDGWLDLFVVNGHVYPEVASARIQSEYAQQPLVFRNREGKRFEEISASSGPAATAKHASRAAAFADYDDDGDIDVAVTNMNEPLSLLRDDGRTENHWVGFRLIGRRSARDALGARVTLTTGSSTQIREVRSGASYLAQSDLRVFFGLGAATRVDRLTIRWPLGHVETVEDLPVDRYATMVEPR